MSIAKRNRKAKNARRRRRRLEVLRRQIFGRHVAPMPNHPDVIGLAYRSLMSLDASLRHELKQLVEGTD